MKKQSFFCSIIFAISFLSCTHSSPNKNANELCTDFYRENRSNHFSVLFDVDMGDRIGIRYCKDGNYYTTFNGVRFHDTYCFMFDSLASISKQRLVYQTKVSYEAKSILMKHYRHSQTETDTFKIYQQTVNAFYKEFNEIKMPKVNPHRNSLIYTNSVLGKYIEFLISVHHTDDEHYWGLVVYYIPNDSILSKQYWTEKINTLNSKTMVNLSLDSIETNMNYWEKKKKTIRKIAPSWYYQENVRLHDGHS